MFWGLIFIIGFAVGLLGSCYFLDFYYRRELAQIEGLRDEVANLRLWREWQSAIRAERASH